MFWSGALASLLACASAWAAPVVFESFTDDPIAAGRFAQETTDTESVFTYNFFRGDLRAFLDVDSSTAYFLSQPFDPITEMDNVSFSARFRVESYDGRSSPTAFIGLATTRHVENFGDGLTMIISTRDGRLAVNASIDQGGLKVEGTPISIALGADYKAFARYSAATRQLELIVYGDATLTTVIGRSTAVLPAGRTLHLDRLGIQNGGARVTDQTVGSITVVVDDLFMPGNGPAPISIAGTSVREGNNGTINAAFEVKLGFAAEQEIRVDYATADGTATAGNDYTSTSGKLIFPPGVTTQTINVPVKGDLVVEADETFSVQLSRPVNGTLANAQATATIVDDDLPLIAVGNTSVVEGNEGSTSATFAVSLNVPSTRTVTFDYTTADGTATAPGDYISRRGTVTFAPGITSQTIVITVNGDRITEPDETFSLALSNPANGILSVNGAVGTIRNNDGLPTVSIDDASVKEGDAGLTSLEFPIRLSNPSSEAVTVSFATANGSAVNGSDYVAKTGAVTFPAGTILQTLVISAMGDLTDEPDETFTVTLANPVNATLGKSEALGTILNDDATPGILAENKSIIEGDSGTATLVFPVRLSNPSSRTVSVDYATVDGTATAGVDYVSASGRLTFLSGIMSQLVVVTINGDKINELNETFKLRLSNPVNSVLTADSAVGTIINDDGATLSIDDVTVTEGNSGTANAIFTVRLSASSVQTVTVNYATADGSATAGSDYVSKTGTLTFPAGVTTQTLLVSVKGDVGDEPDETFFVNLSNPVNATIAKGQGIGTILDDDLPEVSISDTSVTEGNSGTSTAVFSLKLTSSSGQEVTVDYATGDGTGVAGSDYVSTSGRLSFPPGTTSQTITVPVIGDAINELGATCSVKLSNPKGLVVARGQAQGTILNDDEFPTLSINDVTVTEGNSGTVNAIFTVQLSAVSGQTATVGYSTADDTATAGSDYVAKTGTLTFLPGITSQTLTIEVKGDLIDEPNETFFVNLASPSHASIDRGRGTGTIVDDDVPEISGGGTSVREGNSGTTQAVFAVKLSSAFAQEISVDYKTTDGTAVAGSDYVSATGRLIFPPGVTTQNVSILVNGDTLNEPDETFFLELSHPLGGTVAAGSLTGVIINDDGLPSITIDDASVIEGDAGTILATFTVRLSTPSSQPVTVSYETADDTATGGVDCVPKKGTITFQPGEVTYVISVEVKGDVVDEPDETFFVNLKNPINATIVKSKGTGTIVDDDVPQISVADTSVKEGDSGTSKAIFTVKLSSVGTKEVSVDYKTTDGTALAGIDYVSASGRLVFPPGMTTQTVSVLVNGDTVNEPDETFYLELTNPQGGTLGSARGSGVIVNDDGLPTLSIGDSRVAEGDLGNIGTSFTVKLSAVSSQAVTVSYSTADDTATAEVDYISTSGKVTFLPGIISQAITVLVKGDVIDEPNETFFVKLADPINATIAQGRGTGTIIDDDPPQMSITGTSVREGDSGTASAAFEVKLSSPFAQEVSVDFATADGTATAPNDYTSTSGRLVFAPGVTSRTLNVPVKGDLLVEADENFSLELRNPANATLVNALVTGTILDDDFPLITVGNSTVLEGNEGSTSASFAVSLSVPSTRDVSFDYATADGSATAPGDYTARKGTVTFAPGVTSQTIVVDVNGDRITEPDENFTLALSNPANGILSATRAVGTILNDDGGVALFIDDASVKEGNSGFTTLEFSIRLSNPSSETVTVNFATANGTAVSGSDYVAKTGTVTFPAGTTQQTLAISVIGDLTDEPDETFSVSLSNPLHASLGRNEAVGTILDDDATPGIVVENKSILEGDSGTSTMVFPVRLSNPSSRTVTVDYATADGTATAGTDYVAKTGRLTFLPGILNQVAAVTINGDKVTEPNETFGLRLSNPVNSVLTTDSAVGTILNDDGATLSIDDVTVTEGTSGTVNAVFTLRLSVISSQPVTVNYATADGTATGGSDYVSKTGTVTFPAGSTSQSLVIEVKGDLADEPDETFFVNLSNPVNATLARDQGAVTILDDDVPEISIDDIVVNAAKGPVTGTFTLSLSSPSQDSITVNFATANAIATGGSDYEPRSGTLTFPPGTTRIQLPIPVKGNTLDELTEHFFLNLSNPQNATLADPQGICTILNELPQAPACLVPVHVSSFEGEIGGEWSTKTTAVTSTGARRFLGPFGNDDVRLGLSQLPPHSQTRITFDLYLKDSWDGNESVAIGGPDRWSLVVEGGSPLIDTTFSLLPDFCNCQSYPDNYPEGNHPGGTGAVERNTLGYSFQGRPMNAVYHLSFTFPHIAEAAVFNFVGNRTSASAADESWGLDNVLVEVDAANAPEFISGPEPVPGSITSKIQAGSDLILQVVADYVFSYQWLFRGNTLIGATNSTLSLKNLQPGNEGIYSVKAINCVGSTVSTSYNLVLTAPPRSPTISSIPDQTTQRNRPTAVIPFVVSDSDTPLDRLTVAGKCSDATLVFESGFAFGGAGANRTLVITPAPDRVGTNTVTVTVSDGELSASTTFLLRVVTAPVISVADLSVMEGNSGVTPVNVLVKLSEAASEPVTLRYSTRDGTALSGSDYQSAAGALTFAPGEIEKAISISILGDAVYEEDETFSVELSEVKGASVGKSQATITILNDDAPPTVIAEGITVTEGDEGNSDAVLNIRLEGATALPFSFDYTTVGGSALPGVDYLERNGSLSWNPGNLGGGPFSLKADMATDRVLRLSWPFEIEGAELEETESLSGGWKKSSVAVMSSASVKTALVDLPGTDARFFRLVQRSAATGAAANVPATQTIRIPIVGDRTEEPMEAFTVLFSNVKGATLANAEVVVTILDNDHIGNLPPVVRIITPENDDTFPADTSVIIATDASDPDGVVVKVEFFAADSGGTKTAIGTVTKAPFVFTWLNVAQGDYRLTARATDDKGATGESAPVLISVIPPDKNHKRVAIVQNFPDAEISKLQAWVTDLNLSSRVFNQEGLTFAALEDYDLIIWDDLGSPGLTGNDVSIFQQLYDADKPLYFIGDDLVQNTGLLPAAQQSVWRNLLHLKPGGQDIPGKRVSFLKEHPLTDGPFGLTGDFNLQADYDVAAVTGTGEELLATSEAGAVLLANREDSAEATRSVTQNFPAFTGTGLYAHIQREKLFKNAVWWLLKLAPPPPFLDLELTVVTEPEQAVVGAEIKLIASVRHGGELVANGITLAFVLPPGVTYVGSSLGSNDCVLEDGTVICFLGQLSKSETKTVTITVRPDRAGEVTIFGSVSSNQPEAVTENNSSATLLILKP